MLLRSHRKILVIFIFICGGALYFVINILKVESNVNKDCLELKSPEKEESTDPSLCSSIPPGLVGPTRVMFDAPSFTRLESLYSFLDIGGHGAPKNCTALHKVAIVVPYRDREDHLRIFIHNMHPFLQKQQLDYTIVIVEQIANQTFNRAKLMNIGYVEAMKLYPWQCFIFHDVDMLPEDDRNLYTCPDPKRPRHMSVAVDKYNYTLFYEGYFGGVSALTVEQIKKINGMSNEYYGWGGEDDDLYQRVTINGFNITRYPTNISRYKMIKHERDQGNPINGCRWKMMNLTEKRYQFDGLSTLNYKIKKFELLPLYTHIIVDLLEDNPKHILEKDIICQEKTGWLKSMGVLKNALISKIYST